MPRPCGPCSDKARNEIDRRLLEMEISGETFRRISREFGYSEDALARHKSNHLTVDLGDVKATMNAAREEALAELHQKEMEEVKAEVRANESQKISDADKLLKDLKALWNKAISLLLQAEEAGDLRTALQGVREARGCLETLAKIEGQIREQSINIYQQNVLVNHPEWIELRALIISALEPYPEAREAVVHVIHEQ